MAIKINFDTNNNVIQPTFILTTRNGKKIGKLPISNLGFKNGLNTFSELSFKINKENCMSNLLIWNNLVDFKLVWVKEWNIIYEIYISVEESDDKVKSIYAKSLGEAELSQINLYGMEVNTENDIAQKDYEPTIIFNETNSNASLIDKIIEKCPHYIIAHVDESIANLQRTFNFDNITVYEAFQEISKETNCLFDINCRMDDNGNVLREISIYNLETFGNDTTIFITTHNLANSIDYSTDNGAIKNCFKLVAGDDLMTATIANCNPNGSGYIWYVSDEIKTDMSNELVNKLNDYDQLYDYYQNEYVTDVSSEIVETYNELVEKYSTFTNDHEQITLPIIGYPAIMKAYYDTVDFYYYLKDALMPDIEMSSTSAALEAAKLNYANLSPTAVQNLTDSTSSATATSAVLAMAKTLVSSNYQVKISTDDTTFINNMWSGIFVVTNYADEEDTYTTQRITVQITGDYEKYVKQNIEKTLAKASSDSPTDISGLFALEEAGFKIELRKYSLERLRSFHDACQSCLDILIQQGIADRESWTNKDPDLYRDIYLPYYNKLGYIADEMDIRQAEIDIVAGKFDSDGDIVGQGMQTIIESEKNTIQDALNFENYLGTDLWLEFVAYRREDTYENTNFISDGLDNKELFDKALEFIETAKKDIFKSATLQHSISATLKNLLAMKEFEPIVDYFEVGNWLRVKVDDKIYKLRLLEYEIDFDNLENISVVFSDVTIASDGLNDLQSILNNSKDIAKSYYKVSRQAKQGSESKKQLNDWISNGLSLTNLKIFNNVKEQDITWDNHGLLCREYLPITDTYDSKQLKIINKGLYLTDDNWETSKAGIGNFEFWNPETNTIEERYGVIADTIIGRIILGEKVGIYSKDTDNRITIDDDGITTETQQTSDDNINYDFIGKVTPKFIGAYLNDASNNNIINTSIESSGISITKNSDTIPTFIGEEPPVEPVRDDYSSQAEYLVALAVYYSKLILYKVKQTLSVKIGFSVFSKQNDKINKGAILTDNGLSTYISNDTDLVEGSSYTSSDAVIKGNITANDVIINGTVIQTGKEIVATISEPVDINTIQTPGLYYASSRNNILNLPSDYKTGNYSAFFLEVFTHGGNILQRLTSIYDDTIPMKIYMRRITGGDDGVKSWYEFAGTIVE